MPATLVRLHALRGRLALFALGLACAVCAAVLLNGAGPADAAKAKSLGNTRETPRPSCPGEECEAVGSVTGFQQSADGKKGLFKVPDTGHIVGWSVMLSKPDSSQREFFGDFYRGSEFGTAPAASLAVLKPKEKSNFKLKKQSPAIDLKPELGRTPVVTLNDPLQVKQGDVIGLTIPSWLPNFAVEQSREDAWRASRAPQKCSDEADIKQSRPHTEVGETRRYGCRYTTARLLYWAYFVAQGRGDGGGGGNNDGGGGNNR